MHFMPHWSAHYENHNGEFLNSQYQNGTGGQFLFATAGFETAFGRIGCLVQAQQPVVQDVIGTQLGAGGRLNVSINYTFSGKTLL